MLTETLAADTRANEIAGQTCPLVDSAAASRVKWVEIDFFFSLQRFNKWNMCKEEESCVPKHAAITKYVYAFRGSQS